MGPENILPEPMLQGLDASPAVSGQPAFKLAETHKNDLAVMLACCDAEETAYWQQSGEFRFGASPFPFYRVAVLYRKQKNYAAEIEICERWKRLVSDYESQEMVKEGRAAMIQKGPRSTAILERLGRAKQLLELTKK